MKILELNRVVLILILLIVIMLGISMCPAFAVTAEEQIKLFNEAQQLCKLYRTECTVSVVKDNTLAAQTGAYGKIQVSSEMIKRFNENQLRATLYHEVGHVVFKHVETTAEYLYMCNIQRVCNKDYFDNMRRQNELQADRFASHVLKFTGKKNELPEALLILTPPDKINETYPSHPSTAERIERIRRISQ